MDMAEHYSTKGVVTIPLSLKPQIKKIADAYHKATSKDIVITSAKRTAASQASALYTRFSKGGNVNDYVRQTEAKAVKKAYDDAVKVKKGKAAIISAMEQELNSQIKKGKFLSSHLSSKALDVRSKNMSASEKKAFLKSCKAVASKCLIEGTPQHFHLQFK